MPHCWIGHDPRSCCSDPGLMLGLRFRRALSGRRSPSQRTQFGPPVVMRAERRAGAAGPAPSRLALACAALLPSTAARHRAARSPGHRRQSNAAIQAPPDWPRHSGTACMRHHFGTPSPSRYGVALALRRRPRATASPSRYGVALALRRRPRATASLSRLGHALGPRPMPSIQRPRGCVPPCAREQARRPAPTTYRRALAGRDSKADRALARVEGGNNSASTRRPRGDR